MAATKIGYTFKGGGASSRPPRHRGRGILFVLILIASLLGAWWLFVRKSPAPIVDDASTPTTGMEAGDAVRDDGGISADVPPTDVDSESVADVVEPSPPESPPPAPAPPPKRLDERGEKVSRDVREAERLLAAGEWLRARELARQALAAGLPERHPVWDKAADVVGKANSLIFASDVPAPEKTLYTVRSGDSLDLIARKFNTTIEAIQKGNRLDSRTAIIYPGQQLRILRGNWRIRVLKSQYKLYLYDGSDLFKAYDVGIGKQGRTPVGTFDIIEKVKEPDWQYRGKTIPFGSEGNVLGTRWMRLKPTGTTNANLQGYGIHGTWEPDTIGKSMSNGCIRLRNEDVNELYSIIPKYRDADGEFVEVVIEE